LTLVSPERRFSIGFFGFAFYIGNAATLKILYRDGI